jgi:hypothetical protein
LVFDQLAAKASLFPHHGLAYLARMVVRHTDRLNGRDFDLLAKYQKPILKLLALHEPPPNHSCKRCDLLIVGARMIGADIHQINAWTNPNAWTTWESGVQPARSSGKYSAPMPVRDLSVRDPAPRPRVLEVIAAGCRALDLRVDEVLATTFKDV